MGVIANTKAALIILEQRMTDGNVLVKETTRTLVFCCKHEHCVVVGGLEVLIFLLCRSCSMSGWTSLGNSRFHAPEVATFWEKVLDCRVASGGVNSAR